jgi:5-methylcytosine-specific restriction endonuclease McrA
MDAKKDTTQSLFFPLLKRRAKYSTKPNGQFYSYRYFRENFQHEIAEDCLSRCVYCDSPETETGGREQMQLDHFRPYSRKGFESLEDDPENLHHSCGRCNLLKSDKWPSTHPTEPHDGVAGFIDPFADDRRKYFSIENDGELTPVQAPAMYLVRVLALNRPHLKLLRQRRIYRKQLNDFIAKNVFAWEKLAVSSDVLTEREKELLKSLREIKRLYDQCSGS